MANGTSFEIDIDVKAASAVSAASSLEDLTAKLTGAEAATKAANDAVKNAEKSYKQIESAADSASKALEKVSVSVTEQQAKLAKIAQGEDGVVNIKAYQRAEEKLNNLLKRQEEAQTKANSASEAVQKEASSLDALRAAASEAESAQKQLSSAIEQANKLADEQKDAAEASAEAIKQANAEIIASTAERMAMLMRAANEEAKAIAQADAAIAAATANRMGVLMRAANEERKAIEQEDAAIAASTAERMGMLMRAANEEAKAKMAADKAGAPTGKVNELAEAFGALGGPLGMAGQKTFHAAEGLKKMNAALGSAGPYVAVAVAAVAVAAGMAAIGAAAAAAIVHVATWSVGLADAARSSRLLMDGIAGSVAGGEKLDAAISSLAKEVPQSSDALTQMAKELHKAGLSGEGLISALRDKAFKEASEGWGPNFAKQLSSISKQSELLKSNLSALFGGLKIEKLLDNLTWWGVLMDENNASGKAIKAVFESLFQPLVDQAAAWLPKARTAFIQFEIMVMKAMIQIKPFGSKILLVVQAFAVLAALVAGAVAAALVLVAANLAMLAVGFGLIVAGVTAFAAGVVWLVVQLTNLSAAIWGGIVGAFNAVTAWFQGFSLAQMGADLIAGLVNGITGAGASVLSAVTGVVGGAVDAAKNALGIASPSKVFAEIGGYTAEGMSQGVESGAASVQSSMESMVAPPDVSAAGGATGGNAEAGGSGGHTFQITINAGGSGDAQGIAEAVQKAILDILEGDVAQLGAASA